MTTRPVTEADYGSIAAFLREDEERLFGRLHRALAAGGFLVLGKVETLLGASRSRFAVVDARERIYRAT